MDIDLKLLGPYACKFRPPPVFKGTAQKTQSIVEGPKNRRTELFQALHKKKNVKFLQDVEGNRADRQIVSQVNRKEKRDERFMKNRKSTATMIEMIESDLSPEKSSNHPNALSGRAQGDNNSKIISNKNGVNRPAANSNNKASSVAALSAKDASRRDLLLKWKEEKKAADAIVKKKQPFKSGATSTIKPGVSTVSSKNVSTVGGPAKFPAKTGASTFRQPPGTVGAAQAPKVTLPKTNEPPVDGRRVTRAMARGQGEGASTKPNSTSVTNRNGRLVTAAVKVLNISEKPSKNPVGFGSRPAPSNTIKNVFAKDKKVASVAPSTSKTSTRNGIPPPSASKDIDCRDDKVKMEEPQAVKKKLKPKAIDAIYIDYNSKFSNACVKLKSYASEWNKVTLDDTIPEETQGDIHSALGQVKLLLQSKLPQFGELLYSYLCHAIDPMRILPCDLEGWWDVASIQLEAVDATFETLTNLRQSKWIKDQPPESQKNLIVKSSAPQKGSSRSRFPVKAQATGGIKAFLAQKRKMLESNENAEEAGEAMEVVSTTSDITRSEQKADGNLEESANLDKTFEGGFFTISSPMIPKTPSSRRSDAPAVLSAIPAALRTPIRRQSTSETSLNRMSFCILGVRKSMGTFNKIGAVQISSDKDSDDTVDKNDVEKM